MSIKTLWAWAWRRRKRSEEEDEEDEGGVGVGGHENEFFVHTINLIIRKLKEINSRVIDHLISSRSVCSFDFGRARVYLDGKILVK